MGAETPASRPGAHPLGLASMRPRHDGRGNLEARQTADSTKLASMRPRHDGRGNFVV